MQNWIDENATKITLSATSEPIDPANYRGDDEAVGNERMDEGASSGGSMRHGDYSGGGIGGGSKSLFDDPFNA